MALLPICSLAILAQLIALIQYCTGESIPLKVVNLAGAPIDIWWINTFDPTSPSFQSIVPPIRNGSEVSINTFETHQFMIRFVKHVEGIQSLFQKSGADERIVVRFDESTGNLTQSVEAPQSYLHRSIGEAVQYCQQFEDKEFVTCVANSAADEMTRLAASKARLNKYRDNIAFRLRNYTCADPLMQSTTPISSYEYFWYSSHAEEIVYNVSIFLETDHAKIWSVENFLTESECDTLERIGRPILRRATVAAEDGTSVVSDNRRAQQASYNSHQTNLEDDPLFDLQQRILGMTNYHSNYSLTSEGQEGFTIIQYNPHDEYFPHCDGACDGESLIPTGRVATAVMYCKEPEEGGATTFTKADVYVRPKRLSATFFSYMGPDKLMDSGLTEHSGCPIFKGEKMIATFWMRDGVTAEENWTKYDPSGIKILFD